MVKFSWPNKSKAWKFKSDAGGVHTKIRDAAAKGKIERFFGTVRAQFLQVAEVKKVTTLDDLNRRFFNGLKSTTIASIALLTDLL